MIIITIIIIIMIMIRNNNLTIRITHNTMALFIKQNIRIALYNYYFTA